MRLGSWLVIVLAFAAPLRAQTFSRPHAETPTADQPARNLPTTGYTLSLSWAPEFCHGARGQRAQDPECRPAVQRAGFILHGLWPDGAGQDRWPQYCHPVAILTDAEIRAGIAATPSPQLLQHEWAKHGSCMAPDATRYFAEESRLYRLVAVPDMAALARRRALTAGDVATAFAVANPRIPAEAVRVHANKKGWLDEIWLCLDRTRRFAACDADQGGGAAADAPVRIESAYGRPKAGYRSTARRSRSRGDTGRDAGG